ncbi:hypothetical protein TNCV_4575871 [Trichonephila clavipes]|nr:hypothetical protein TNCV_4575871 [Trichonephila clavipes]
MLWNKKNRQKPFLRIPIDLTLEQTINAEAARCLSGITHFTNSLAARQLWTKSHMLNFAGAPKKKKVTLGNKVIELRMQRDLFGRLIGISMTNKVDVEKVLGFPLMPIPTSMYHTYDGFFMLHIMKEVPQNFDGISKKFLKMISQFKSSRIDIVFDQYFTPSIKDCERLRLNETTSTVSIGPNQIRHHNFAEPTLLEYQNTKQDDDYDDIDNNGCSDNDDDYEDASVFCDTFTE